MSEASLEDLLFLSICTLVPVLMGLALALVALRRVRDALSFRRALRLGWESLSEADVRAQLHGLPPLDRSRVRLSRCAARSGEAGRLATCLYHWSSGGPAPDLRSSRREAWLIVPVLGGGALPHAVIARRASGAGGRVSGAVAAQLGGQELSLTGAWRGLRVTGPTDAAWFTDARGVLSRALLGPGEELWLHGNVAVLAIPELGHTHLMYAADSRARALLDALAGRPSKDPACS